jgi:hypothetical protein
MTTNNLQINFNSPSSKNLLLKEVKSNEQFIEVLQKGDPNNFHLGYLYKAKPDTTIFYNPAAELFNKFNAIGLLSEVIEDRNLDFKYLTFVLNGKRYNTTRSQFLENGIRETFYFGEKIFLPLSYFEKLDEEQISMNFKSENE